MSATYLVTGGTGFLGQHLVRQLIERDNATVRVLARSTDRALERLGVEMIQGSILDPEAVLQAAQGVDGIFHLAGRVERDLARSHVLYTLHVSGTRNVLDAAHQAGVKRTVIASTSGTVGVTTDGRTIPNDRSAHVTELARNWPYYLSKIYAERTALALAKRRDLDVILMRPTLLLGPGDDRLSSTRDVLNFIDGKIPIVPSGGLSFVDVRDTAEAFRIAMTDGTAGATYLLGSINLTFEAFFERLEAISGTSRPYLQVPDKIASLGSKALDFVTRSLGQTPDIDPISVEMSQHFWYIDWSSAIQDLKWSPRDPSQTLYDTVQWLRTNRPTPSAAPVEPSPNPQVHDPSNPFQPANTWADNGDEWRHTQWDQPTTDAYGKPAQTTSTFTPPANAPYAAYQGQSEIHTGDISGGPGLESLLSGGLTNTVKNLVSGALKGSSGHTAPTQPPYASTAPNDNLHHELQDLDPEQRATVLRLIRNMKA